MPSLAVLGLRCWIRTKVSVFQCGLLGVSLAQLGGDSAKGRPSRTETFQGLLPESCRGRRSNYTDPSSHHCHTHAHALVSTKRREALGSAIIGFIRNHLGSSSHTDTHIPKYPETATLIPAPAPQGRVKLSSLFSLPQSRLNAMVCRLAVTAERASSRASAGRC